MIPILIETATASSNPDEFFLEFDAMNPLVQDIQDVLTYISKHENEMNLIFHNPCYLHENEMKRYGCE